jgi:hypothetical protein
MTDSNIITVSEFGLMSPKVDTSSYADPTISGFISAASKIASDYLEYSPLAEDIVGELKDGRITTEGDLLIFPNKIPVITLSSISIARGTTNVALTLTNGQGANKYNIDVNARTIRYPYQEIVLQGTPVFTDFYNLRGLQFYTKISYRGGYEASALPQPIKQAVAMIVQDLLSTQANPTGATEIRQGSLSFKYNSFDDSQSPVLKMALRLLNPYRRIG